MRLQVLDKNASDTIHEAVRKGVPPEESVVMLHDMGLSVIGSTRIIREAYNMSLSEAKRIVANHPIWKKLSDAATSLHEEIENCLPEALISLQKYEDVESFTLKRTVNLPNN